MLAVLTLFLEAMAVNICLRLYVFPKQNSFSVNILINRKRLHPPKLDLHPLILKMHPLKRLCTP